MAGKKVSALRESRQCNAELDRYIKLYENYACAAKDKEILFCLAAFKELKRLRAQLAAEKGKEAAAPEVKRRTEGRRIKTPGKGENGVYGFYYRA
jgi:hypothetical protein